MSAHAGQQRVAVLGLGLMGGSLCMALRRLPQPVQVAAWSRTHETREQALRLGVADLICDTPEAACLGANVVVLCAPVLALAGLLERCLGALAPQALVTDVGSAKALVVREAERIMKDSHAMFLGSHPIAGAEQHGIAAARANLYQGAVVVLTPTPASKPNALSAARTFWTGLGAKVRVLSPDEHDQVLARTSHLPHMVATALACAVARETVQGGLKDFCGPGFRDATRVAAGDPALWCDIAKSNHAALRWELGVLKTEIERVIDAMDAEDFNGVRAFLEQGRLARSRTLGTQEEANA